MGIAGIPRVSRGNEDECCGNTAGMVSHVAVLPREWSQLCAVSPR
jgi:hypothetical protein